MKEKLIAAVGKYVRLVNEAEEQSESNKVQIHVHGLLEYDADENTFYVRVGECPRGHGSNGVTFQAKDVLECSKQLSGIIFICLN